MIYINVVKTKSIFEIQKLRFTELFELKQIKFDYEAKNPLETSIGILLLF